MIIGKVRSGSQLVYVHQMLAESGSGSVHPFATLHEAGEFVHHTQWNESQMLAAQRAIDETLELQPTINRAEGHQHVMITHCPESYPKA